MTGSIYLRPRIGRLVVTAGFFTVFLYAVLKIAGHEHYPFGIAALLGGARFLFGLRGRLRTQGVRVDDAGVTDLEVGTTLRWADITAIRVEVAPRPLGKREQSVRIATVATEQAEIQFADLGPAADVRLGNTMNLPTAGALLALIASRVDARALFPESWAGADDSTDSAPVSGVPEVRIDRPGWRASFTRALGSFAVLIKLGPKLVALILKLLKTVKLGAAAVTVGTYALIVSWKFAFALVGMVLIHECGHVYAMWRTGVGVKGIYFVPFFGGAAVARGIAGSRWHSAYIAINGPIWGAAFALVCFAVFAASHGELAFIGTLAAWGALMNLFNLLPIFPLDGGRIVASLAYAAHRGPAVIAGSLALGTALAYVAELELLLLVGLLGLGELGAQVSAAAYRPMLAAIGSTRRLDPAAHEHFARHVAVVEPGRQLAARQRDRSAAFTRITQEAAQTPMTLRQSAIIIAGYLLLVAALVAVLFATADITGSGGPLDLLR